MKYSSWSIRAFTLGVLGLALCLFSVAQKEDYSTIFVGVLDASNATLTAPFRSVAALPSGPCTPSEEFVNLTTDNDHFLFRCNTTGDGWVEVGLSATESPLTEKGDIYIYSSTNARLPIGQDGTIPIADSAEPLGLRFGIITSWQQIPAPIASWTAPPSGGAVFGTLGTAPDVRPYAGFADDIVRSMTWMGTVPQSYAAGNTVEFSAGLTITTTATGAKGVWQLCTAFAGAIDEVVAPVYTCGPETPQNPPALNKLFPLTLTPDMTGAAAGKQMFVRLLRSPGHVEDTWTGELKVINAVIRFEIIGP